MDYAAIDIQTGGAPRPFYYRQGSCDEAVIKQIFGDHDYALNRLRRFPELLEHQERKRATGLKPLIVDAGANIGASSVYFSLNFPDAVVISVEPDLGNFQLLARNANGLPIEPELAAVGAETGRMRVVDPGESFWGFRTAAVGEGEAAGGVDVPSRRMNDIYQRCATRCFPFIAKIDIEGGEGDLFRANTEWVARTPILIIELHDWMLPKQGTSAAFLRCIAALDRDFVHIGENVFSIANDLDAL
jgi:FkbM family methyltransferase